MCKLKLIVVLLAAIFFAVSGKADAAPNWNTNTIQVTGMGVANPNMAVTPAHASMLARRAAISDAYRQLLEVVQGVNVDADTTIENMMVQSDVIRVKVTGVVKGARIIDEGELAGGGYSVTMEISMFGGEGSLAETVLERPTYVEPIPAPAPEYRPPVIDNRPTYSGGYTGLIVDCRGLGGVNPVMSPVIKNDNGQKIYGHKNLDFDRIIREGMASYARNMSETSRAGSNPLIVTAIDVEDHNANPVLSNSDADLVLYENSRSHFLENIAVVFLY